MSLLGTGGGWDTRLREAVNNPLFQIGLGILANNNSDNFGQVVGRGGLMGLRNLQQQQLMAQRQQQTDLIAKRLEAQTKEIERKAKQGEKQKQAGDKFKEEFPQYASVYDISPAQAMKLAYPQASSNADPYFSPVYDSQRGLGAFNARTGETTWQGGAPIIKPSDDPRLQGDLSYSKQFGKARATPTDMEDGVIQTEAQLINKLGASQGANPWQIPPEVQAQRDKEARAIIAAEQGQGNLGVTPPMPYNLPTGGIKVPTEAEQAAAKEEAKLSAKTQQEAKNELSLVNDLGNEAINLVDELIQHKGFKDAVGLSSYNPLNRMAGSPANDFNIRLDQIKGKQFLQAFETLKGGGQITEIEGKKATDAISRMNTSASEEEFVQAAREFQEVIRKGMDRAQARAGVSSSAPPASQNTNSKTFNEMPPANKYKGQIIRDSETGKRFKSNGLQWKEL